MTCGPASPMASAFQGLPAICSTLLPPVMLSDGFQGVAPDTLYIYIYIYVFSIQKKQRKHTCMHVLLFKKHKHVELRRFLLLSQAGSDFPRVQAEESTGTPWGNSSSWAFAAWRGLFLQQTRSRLSKAEGKPRICSARLAFFFCGKSCFFLPGSYI